MAATSDVFVNNDYISLTASTPLKNGRQYSPRKGSRYRHMWENILETVWMWRKYPTGRVQSVAAYRTDAVCLFWWLPENWMSIFFKCGLVRCGWVTCWLASLPATQRSSEAFIILCRSHFRQTPAGKWGLVGLQRGYKEEVSFRCSMQIETDKTPWLD